MSAVDDLAVLTERARGGDSAAWSALVERYAPLVWSVIRTYRLSDADAQDVFQTVWLDLLQHLPTLRDPAALPGWLATIARRKAHRLLRSRLLAQDPAAFDEPADPGPSADETLMRAERDARLWRAIRQLSPGCQRLLRLLVTDPPPSYAEVSAALNLSIGSIGPTRRRCLEHLRRLLADDSGATEPELLEALHSGNLGYSQVPAGAVDEAADALTNARREAEE